MNRQNVGIVELYNKVMARFSSFLALRGAVAPSQARDCLA
jgi:hypothetical protein